MTKDKATATWSQADANGVYWWRYDKSYTPEVVEVRDGNFYSIAESDPISVSVGEFLGPLTPDLFAEVARLTKAARGALTSLEDRHVDENLFRLGLIGKQEVESARHILRAALSS